MKTYPLVADYKIAVTIPDSFATLNTLEPCYVGKDLFFATGGPAVVFKMKDTNTRQYSAIKCFIKEFSERSHHFSHISKFLASLPSNPYFVNYSYYNKEIWVNDDEYPVLQMPWIEGKTLSQAIPELCREGNTAAIQELANKFDKMALWLLEQDMAHGDLKPDNIIVTSNNELMLVDYDGMFVPSLAGSKSPELGTAEYRHPKRTGTDFNRHLDDFPILVLSLSLHALAHSPELYVQAGSGDALLFTSADYKNLLTCPQMKFFQSNAKNTVLFSRFSMLMNAVMLPVLELVGLRELLRETANDTSNLKNDTREWVEIQNGKWHEDNDRHTNYVNHDEVLKSFLDSYSSDDSIDNLDDDPISFFENLRKKNTRFDSKIDGEWVDEFGVTYSLDRTKLIKSQAHITSYVIKDGTEFICDDAFFNNKNLTSIFIPETVSMIGNNAFQSCIALTSVSIPNSVCSFGDSIFSSCSSLTSIVIPESMKFIENSTFNGCTSLSSITIPNSVISIEDGAFSDCTSLTSIIIPEFITYIGDAAFSFCSSLTSVTLPNSIEFIGVQAFAFCYALKSITIPNLGISIGAGAFGDCPFPKKLKLELSQEFGEEIFE